VPALHRDLNVPVKTLKDQVLWEVMFLITNAHLSARAGLSQIAHANPRFATFNF
jgi:hypothetical protein